MPKIDLKPYHTYIVEKYTKPKRFNIIWKLVYNTDRWRKMRINYLGKNPICEVCNKNLATEVHHKIPISNAGSNVEMIYKLGFDVNNLMSICKECHILIHNESNRNK